MNKKQKILAIFTLGLVLFLFLTNIQVSAEETSLAKPEKSNFFAGVVGDAVGWVSGMALGGLILGISYIVGFLASIVVLLGGALTNFALAWNYAILANPIIEVGWQITMGIANLGFVLFIIVIAIATILRFQQYGAKDALGKLIAVALLVNFSLVFAGVFIDFSNMLTRFFINNITGAGLSGLGTALVAPINPQKFLEIKDTNEIEAFAASFGGTLKNIAGAFFSAVFTLITGFCLLAIATMLLVRFVSLSVLLVLAPLACLFIILPATKKLWDQWWGEFMKWILFAPIVSFFFYLAVYLSTKFDEITKGLSLEAQGIGKGTEAYIAFGNIPTKDFFTSVANLVITVGFLIGGLMAANSMGITGSKAFLGVAQSAGKWARGAIGGMVKRNVTELASRPFRGEGAQARAKRMQESRWAPMRFMGGAMYRVGVQQGEKLTKDAEKRLEGISDAQLAVRFPHLNQREQVVAVKRFLKNKTTGLLRDQDLNSFIGKSNTENIFKSYGAGNVYDDFQKAAGRSTAMFTGKDKEGNSISHEDAQKQLFRSFTLKDAEGLRKKSFTEDEDAIANVRAITQANPGMLSKLMPKFSGVDFDKFMDNLIDATPEITEKIELKRKLKKGDKEAAEAIEVIKDYTRKYYPAFHKSFDKSLNNRILGFGEYTPPTETIT